jgi:hypothetical protein
LRGTLTGRNASIDDTAPPHPSVSSSSGSGQNPGFPPPASTIGSSSEANSSNTVDDANKKRS